MTTRIAVAVALVACLTGCPNGFIEPLIFPFLEPNLFDENPAPLGPYAFNERRVELDVAADGRPNGITIIEPVGAPGPRPLSVWLMGSNVEGHYQQSLHENLASWGYVVVIPDPRPILFTDFQYHKRIIDLGLEAFDLALDGTLGVSIDPDRTAFGGYSIGGTLSAFAAAMQPEADLAWFWAPSSAPIWQGIDPEELWPQVTQPTFYMLGELDPVAPLNGFPRDMQEKMVNSTVYEYIIEDGVHLYFQQPTGVDDRNPPTDITRLEQQAIAIEQTRLYLDQILNITRD